jgi:transposase-like protein
MERLKLGREFKIKAVRLIKESSVSVTVVAQPESAGISASTYRNRWPKTASSAR